jgi:predicted aldo/keto reductase-like oxidoreductase
MLYRKVPKNGDQLSTLGYGCMRLPSKMGSIDEKTAERQICSAIDRGINYIDTAVPYHNGKSEPFLGKIMDGSGYRNKVKLATKLPHWAARSKEDMDRILDKQLNDLRTDRIDYYLIHNLNGNSWDDAKENGVREFLDGSLKSGKIVNAGFSYHGGSEDFVQVVDEYDWTFCQIQYNYLDTQNQAGTRGLQYAASKDLAVMVMEPLRGGHLGKTPPPEVKKLWDSSPVKRTPAEWALRWVLNHPEVTVVLSGMNDDRHIEENLNIADTATPGCLTDQEREIVEKVRETFQKIMKVGCTGCQYCMPCPGGVNIPVCFQYFNSRHAFKDKTALLYYLAMNGGVVSDKTSFASQCIKCKICLEKCPQGIPIPDMLDLVAKDMEGILTKPLLFVIKKVMRTRKKNVKERRGNSGTAH